jgi:hypothetical protein
VANILAEAGYLSRLRRKRLLNDLKGEAMKKKLLGTVIAIAMCIGALPSLAGDPDPNQCLECHEPAEDWEGMSTEEILADAKGPDNKRHKANQELTDEQLRLIIATLVPE